MPSPTDGSAFGRAGALNANVGAEESAFGTVSRIVRDVTSGEAAAPCQAATDTDTVPSGPKSALASSPGPRAIAFTV